MITLQNQTITICDLQEGQVAFTNCGSWQLDGVLAVKGGTNAPVDVSGLRDGAVVLVDVGGRVVWTDGPDITGNAISGFSLAIGTLGIALSVRWALAKVFSAGNVAGRTLE